MDDILTWEKEVAHILVTKSPLKAMNICPWNQFTMTARQFPSPFSIGR